MVRAVINAIFLPPWFQPSQAGWGAERETCVIHDGEINSGLGGKEAIPARQTRVQRIVIPAGHDVEESAATSDRMVMISTVQIRRCR